MKPSRRTAEAFTLIELTIVVACLVILGAILLPSLARPPHHCGVNCSNNLKQIGRGFRTWAIDNNDRYPMQVPLTNGGTMELVNSGTVFPHFLVMSNELSTPKLLICPAENNPARTTATTFDRVARLAFGQIPFTNDNNVSYFVGVDADQSQPAMLLAGDGNLSFNGVLAKHGLQQLGTNSAVGWANPRHDSGGNICFADGSVQRIVNREWPVLLSKTGQATNRLALP